MDVDYAVTGGAGMLHILAFFDEEGDHIARPAAGLNQQNGIKIMITSHITQV